MSEEKKMNKIRDQQSAWSSDRSEVRQKQCHDEHQSRLERLPEDSAEVNAMRNVLLS